MADLKTEQGITAEIQKQRDLLKDIDGRTKAGIKLKEKIITLEEKLFAVQNRKTAEEANINKEIQKRIAKVRELSTQENVGAKLKTVALKSQNQTLNLISSQVSAGAQLKGTLKEQQDVVLALGSGMNDIAGIQNLQIQSSDRMNKLSKADEKLQDNIKRAIKAGNTDLATKLQMKSEEIQKQQKIEGQLQENLKTELEVLQVKKKQASKSKILDQLTGGLYSKQKEIRKELEEADKGTSKLIIGSLAIGAVIGLISKSITAFATKVDEIGKSFGSLRNVGEEFKDTLIDAELGSIQLGFGMNDVASATSTLTSEFGFSLKEASELSEKVLDTAKATGLSVDESAKLFGSLQSIVGLTKEESENLIEGASQLAVANKVAPTQVLKDIAASTENIAIFTKDSGENLFKAAVQARAFGVNIDSIAKSARGMLDFETSINDEIEASVLLGKQLNLQKARQLALDKDLTGFQKEIKNQLSGIGDFTALNVFQQESLAKALGMSVEEVAKLSKGTDELTLSSALSSGEDFNDMLGKDALSNISKLTGKFKEFGAIILNSVGGSLDSVLGAIQSINLEDMKGFIAGITESVGGLISKFSEFISSGEALEEFKSIVKSVAATFSFLGDLFLFVASNFKLLLAGFVGISSVVTLFKVLGATAFKSLMVQLANLAGLGAVLAGPAAPIVMPIILTGLIAGITGIISSIAMPSMDDGEMKSDGTFIASPKGTVRLNNADSAVFGTKLDESTISPTISPNFGTQTAGANRGLSDADASRIGKAMADGFDGSMGAGLSDADASRIGKAMASNMRFETTVTNRQQQIIIDGALNPLGGRPITA